MITEIEFRQIEQKVKDAVEQVFDYIKNRCKEENYILFLADAEFNKMIKVNNINPNVIDSREDRIKDQTRFKFFLEVLNNFFHFPEGVLETKDNEYKLSIELMVYTHIWESKPYLKQLFRIASLANAQTYTWDVNVPEMGKHSFIRNQIRDVFKTKALLIGSIISKGFHSSLRNAFAHSEYLIDEGEQIIMLDTYQSVRWDIREISFKDWTKRFLYTALLSYYIFDEKFKRRSSVVDDFGKDKFLINLPDRSNVIKEVYIYYDSKTDMFSFYKRN